MRFSCHIWLGSKSFMYLAVYLLLRFGILKKLLNMFSMTLICISSPCCMPMIHKFGLLTCPEFFCLLFQLYYFFNYLNCLLCTPFLQAQILCLPLDSVNWLGCQLSFLFVELFISKISFWFFSESLPLHWTHILNCILYFIQLFVFSLHSLRYLFIPSLIF
jgi:hypothetical protein